MKRFRISSFHLDSRASDLNRDIPDNWDEPVKLTHRKSREQTIGTLIQEYGTRNNEIKVQNFAEMGDLPLSIVAYHNKFIDQIRSAFVIGAYYPALTATAALGERILNHLILALREDYSPTPEFKYIRGKQSFDNWTKLIKTLTAWSILVPEAQEAFEKLHKLRNYALHFRFDVDKNDRALALEAIQLMTEIIHQQFSGFSNKPWFIVGIPGESYIKKDFETNPFVKRIYLPNCHLVTPFHWITSDGNRLTIQDYDIVDAQEITDEEFVRLRLERASYVHRYP